MRGHKAGRGAHSCVPTVAYQRTLCGLLGKAFQGRLGGKRVPCGYPAILPSRRLWEHCKLHGAASRRGQRSLQRSAGVHRLPRQRSVALRQNSAVSISEDVPSRSNGGLRKTPVHLGSHCSANRAASAICAGVILVATSLRSFTAMESDGARDTARLSHMRAITGSLGTP